MDTVIIVGTYTKPLGHVHGKAKGIHVLRHNVKEGTLHVVASDVEGFGEGPSYLSTLRSQRSDDGATLRVALVACNEGEADLAPSTLTFAELSIPMSNHDDGSSSSVVTAVSRGVAVIGAPPTPCHVSASGQWVVAATYCGGSVSSHKVTIAEVDGHVSVSDAVCLVQQSQFSNINQSRQEAAHAHQAIFLNETTLLVCDLGADSVTTYHLDSQTGGLTYYDIFALPPGCGPRHLAVHPSKSFAFILGELNNTVYCAKITPSENLSTFELVGSAPSEPVVGGGGAGIVISSDGVLIFASFRGSCDRVDVFRFDETTLQLVPAGRLLVDSCPRDICLHPAAPFLYVASQNGDTVTAYPYILTEESGGDGFDGTLRVTFGPGVVAQCSTPVCLIPIVV